MSLVRRFFATHHHSWPDAVCIINWLFLFCFCRSNRTRTRILNLFIYIDFTCCFRGSRSLFLLLLLPALFAPCFAWSCSHLFNYMEHNYKLIWRRITNRKYHALIRALYQSRRMGRRTNNSRNFIHFLLHFMFVCLFPLIFLYDVNRRVFFSTSLFSMLYAYLLRHKMSTHSISMVWTQIVNIYSSSIRL